MSWGFRHMINIGIFGVLVPANWWRPLAVVSAVISLAGLILFGRSWPLFNFIGASAMNIAALCGTASRRTISWLVNPVAVQFQSPQVDLVRIGQAGFFQHAARGDVIRMHKPDDRIQACRIKTKLDGGLSSFGGKPVPPCAFPQQIGHFGLVDFGRYSRPFQPSSKPFSWLTTAQ